MKLLVYGPVFPYVHSKPRHRDFDESRVNVATLEKRLWNMARDAGHQMLNSEPNGKHFDETLWIKISDAFRRHLVDDPIQ
jgi:hypothetical protein